MIYPNNVLDVEKLTDGWYPFSDEILFLDTEKQSLQTTINNGGSGTSPGYASPDVAKAVPSNFQELHSNVRSGVCRQTTTRSALQFYDRARWYFP